MHNYSLKELAYRLQKKEFSSVELTRHYLNRIGQNKGLNAFINVNEEEALSAAMIADKLIAAKQATSLTGIPMAHKDLFCTHKFPTTCGSKMLADFQSPYQATMVNKLALQGVVLVGKTNMDEFAMGCATEYSYFGPTKNPWNNNYVPGGSSGGSAAAVAADLVPYATGSDTGGSIRQPAAFCGICGIKPTYGLISRFGMIAYASSLDQAGVLAHNAEDLSLVLKEIVGFDNKDSTSVMHKPPNYYKSLSHPIKKLRIAIPGCFLQQETEIEIKNAIMKAVNVLQDQGAEIIELNLDLQNLWVPCYYVIACAEASSNLSRYDGIRFGYRSQNATTIQELIKNSRTEGFGVEVQRRILTGTHVLSSGYFEAYYLQALKIRRLIKQEFQQALEKVDIIVAPTTPTTAFKLGEHVNNPIQNYLSDVFTVAINLAGLPAMSIPVGFSNGLPIGMQLIGNFFQEALLLNIAYHYQKNTTWHQARPNNLT